ncbi:ATP-binding protein [Umezawaea tangerina]|uniref:ATP-binding protein n=1 Tax=Umezawaea tangerina TaxID=84725 RepID=UPI0014754D1F|nr:NB-ARC domain-containing protein [Umezawaea tangerina]
MEEILLSNFGELLFQYRKRAGRSQQELARLSGVSVRALRELEHGRARAAQRRSAEVLADALGLEGGDRAGFLKAAQDGRRRGVQPPPGSLWVDLPLLPVEQVGRDEEVDRLRQLLAVSATVAIVGQPGVGKTVLAVLAAHRLRQQFPDGCFAIDLRGVDDEPLRVRMVFDRLLRAFGLAPAEIPATEAEQAGVYRATLAKRRVLVLLDNAFNEAQIRPLLTSASDSRVLVTCRRTLAGLEGVRWLHLGPLSELSARELLHAFVGQDRIDAESEETNELVALCGNLPLALRIVGDRLATRLQWSIGYLVDQLRDEGTRLTSLSAGDLQVRRVFEVSYRRLSPPARALFCRLAVVPGTDFGIELVTVAGELTEWDAMGVLDELVDASMLLTGPQEGRFRFHDLLRIFAKERWKAEHESGERDRITRATVSHLLGAASAAGMRFYPDPPPDEVFDSFDQARDWLDLERSNWLAAVRKAARMGWHAEVLALARAMHWYSDSYWTVLPWEEVFRLGLAAARALDDASAEAQQLNFVGWAMRKVQDDGAALECHLEALRVATENGDLLEQTWALAYAGTNRLRLGQREEALTDLRRAVELAADFDFWTVQLPVGHRYGFLLLDSGRAAEGLAVQQGVYAHAERLLSAERHEGRLLIAAQVLEGVAQCQYALGRWEDAAAGHAAARHVYVDSGSDVLAVRAGLREGQCWIAAGDHEKAHDALDFALVLSEEKALPTWSAEVRAALARLSSS